MKKLLYPICVCVLLLSACAKKATFDRMMCDCLDKETAAYIAAHPNFTKDDLATAKEAIGIPCLAEFQKAYPESEQKEFDKQYTKEEQKAMESAMQICTVNFVVTLQKVADKNSATSSSEAVKGEQDTLDVDMFAELPTDAKVEALVSDDDKTACDKFLTDYEDYANSYAVLAAKYAKNPMDMTIVQEYTEMATKAQEMQQDKPDACDSDGAFMKRYTRVTAKVTKAAAAQMQGSAKMLEQMSK